MKTHTAAKRVKKGIERMALGTAVLSMLFLLAACGGTTTKSAGLTTKPRPKIEKHEIISAYELHKILTDHFGFINIKLSDVQYALTDNSKLDQLSASDYCKLNGGVGKENWGGDDYAIAGMVPMRNYAFGTMYNSSVDGNKKVMNVLVNNEKKVVYWEPKACQMYAGNFENPEFILF